MHAMLDHTSVHAAPETGLVRYDAMCRAIDAAYEVDEVKAIHDQAAMLQAAARVAHNVDAETRAYEIRMRAARKAGALSKKIERCSGGDHRSKNQTPRTADFDPKGKVLQRAGVSTQQASGWERLSEVPEDKFEAALANRTVNELIDRITPVSGEALLFVGTMRDFERRGYLARTPADFMATMDETMLEEVYRIAPLASAWLATIRNPDNG
jgi:hypothetical protein